MMEHIIQGADWMMRNERSSPEKVDVGHAEDRGTEAWIPAASGNRRTSAKSPLLRMTSRNPRIRKKSDLRR